MLQKNPHELYMKVYKNSQVAHPKQRALQTYHEASNRFTI